MAVVANTLIGRSRKSVGNATFSRWKNLNILKEKAKPANPQSDNQMMFRARFSILIHLSSLIQGTLRYGYRQYRAVMTEFNKFVSINSKNGFLRWNTGSLTWDAVANQLEISKGSLQQTPVTFTGVADGDTVITINWDTDLVANQSDTDQVGALVLQYGGPGSQGGVLFPTIAYQRSTGTAEVVLAEAAQSTQALGLYVYFMRADGTIVSNNTYLNVPVV